MQGGSAAGYWLKTIALNSLVLSLMGLITYWPAASLEYGRADDYWFAAHNATNTPETTSRSVLEAGRPIAALINRWLFPQIDTVPELLWMRLAAIVALALTGVALSVVALRLLGAPRSRALRAMAVLVGLVALVTPAAPSAATWGSMALELWALPLALAGGLVATAQRNILRLRWEVAAGILVLLATFTYQPAAAACLLPVFMWSALGWARDEPPQWHRPVVVAGLLLASLGCNVAVVKIFDWAGNDRLGGNGLGESLLWFIAAYLPRSIDFAIPTSRVSAELTFLVLALALLSPRAVGRRFLALPAAVLCAWFIASAIVVPGELVATYRLVMTSQTLLWSGSLICLVFATQQLGKTRPQAARSLLTAMVLGAVALVTVSGFRAYAYLAMPNAIDWVSMQCALREAGPLTQETALVRNPLSASTSPVIAGDDYGWIGSSHWVLPEMAWLAARAADEHGRTPKVDAARLKVVTESSGSTAPRAVQVRQGVCRTHSARSGAAGHGDPPNDPPTP